MPSKGLNAHRIGMKLAIDLDETLESLETKLRKTYCAPGDVENNPILSWYKSLLFPLSDTPLEFGTSVANNYSELEAMWRGKKISPQELKKATARDLGRIVLP